MGKLNTLIFISLFICVLFTKGANAQSQSCPYNAATGTNDCHFELGANSIDLRATQSVYLGFDPKVPKSGAAHGGELYFYTNIFSKCSRAQLTSVYAKLKDDILKIFVNIELPQSPCAIGPYEQEINGTLSCANFKRCSKIKTIEIIPASSSDALYSEKHIRIPVQDNWP